MVNQIRRLPWFVALLAFALYAGTMGGGVGNNLSLAAKVAGWDETPMVGQPLLWLLMLPLHLLPATWAPLALKLFTAALAALTLGLLTRTVQMLPWDYPWENASRFTIALPVLAASTVCGLEFGFWQGATAGNGEMLDLLMLAAGIWLLQEYNVRRVPRWLDAAVIVWGLGMAQNWLMLLALPLFVIAIIWLEGVGFFQWKFVLRLAGLGLAGFSIYAVLPFAIGLNPHSPWTLAQAWIATLRQTKIPAQLIYQQFWRSHRSLALGVAICFLVPTLPLLVRLRDEGTQNKSGVDIFQAWVYRFLRVGVLLACLWLAFDPSAGPQQLVQHQFGVWMPMLTFDYLNALGVAFLLGNLLLIPRWVVDPEYAPQTRMNLPWRQITIAAAIGGIVLMTVGLVARNAPTLVRSNFHPLNQFGERAVKSLPAGGGVMLSDFPDKLMVFQAALAHRHEGSDWLAVDTRALPTVAYRAKLERRQPAGWLTDTNRHELTPLGTLRLLEQVARTNRLFYLHPSHGYFFEAFYLEPADMIYEMKLRPKDPLDLPPLSAAALDANEKFWTGLWDEELAALATPPAHRPAGFAKQLARLGVSAEPRNQDRLLAGWYSIPLEAWATTLQKQGRLPAARQRFTQVLQLNTNNLSARISLACNTNLEAGNPMGLSEVAKVAGQLESPNRVNLIMNNYGPFDEPVFDYLLGSVFMQAGELLQAAEQFERVRTLTPGSLAPELALAQIYNRLQMTDRARPLISHLREEAAKLPENSSLDLNLALLESYSWLLQTNVSNARSALQSVVEQHPEDTQVKSRVLGAYLAIGDFTNALQLVETQLAKTPDDVPTLNSKAMILIQSKRAAEALPILDHVLTLTNLPAARINRAFARLTLQDFTDAEKDFSELEKTGEAAGLANFGLAAVAENRKDTNQAVRYLRLCLTNTPAGTPLWQQASYRLLALEPAPTK